MTKKEIANLSEEARKEYYAGIAAKAKATKTAKAEAEKAAKKAEKEKAEAEKAEAEKLRKSGLESPEVRNDELKKTIDEKKAENEAEKAEAENERVIDSAPAEIRAKVESLRKEVATANKAADHDLNVFATSHKEAAYGKGTKIHWFDARRIAAERVLEYMREEVWKVTAAFPFEEEEARLDALIEAAQAEKKAEAEKEYIAQKAKISAKKAAVIKDERSFHFTQEERKIFAEYESAKNDKERREALVKFYKSFAGLNLEGNEFIIETVAAFGHERSNSARKFCASGGTIATCNVKSSEIVKYVFRKTFEAMYSAGTIKAIYVPEEVRKHCAPKKAK